MLPPEANSIREPPPDPPPLPWRTVVRPLSFELRPLPVDDDRPPGPAPPPRVGRVLGLDLGGVAGLVATGTVRTFFLSEEDFFALGSAVEADVEAEAVEAFVAFEGDEAATFEPDTLVTEALEAEAFEEVPEAVSGIVAETVRALSRTVTVRVSDPAALLTPDVRFSAWAPLRTAGAEGARGAGGLREFTLPLLPAGSPKPRRAPA